MSAALTQTQHPPQAIGNSKKNMMTDLRRTHFELGHDKKSDYKSVYINDYNEHPIDVQAQTVSGGLLRKTHFVAGVDDMERRFKSIYKEDYLEHPPG